MDRLRNFGFLLKDVSRRHVQRFEERAAALALTLPQCKVLTKLEAHEGTSQARLAEIAELEPMTLVRILDRMEADGMLERRPDPDDRRARRLYLTDKARPLIARIWHLSDLTRAEMFAGIAARDRKSFMDVLEHIHANAVALPGRPLADPVDDAVAPTRTRAAPRPRRNVHTE